MNDQCAGTLTLPLMARSLAHAVVVGRGCGALKPWPARERAVLGAGGRGRQQHKLLDGAGNGEAQRRHGCDPTTAGPPRPGSPPI